MARYTATESWQSVTLAKNELWYCHRGLLAVQGNTVPGANDGQPLTPGQSIEFEAGVTVYYRAARDMPTDYERTETSA